MNTAPFGGRATEPFVSHPICRFFLEPHSHEATGGGPVATKAKGNNGSKKSKDNAKKSKNPRCRTCDKVIRVPKGWTQGPAIRRHYWREHREIMQGRRGS